MRRRSVLLSKSRACRERGAQCHGDSSSEGFHAAFHRSVHTYGRTIGPNLRALAPYAQISARSGSSSCITGGADSSLHSRNSVWSAGTTTSMMMGPTSMPPTTTVASGFCTWLPMPLEIAAGSRPMQADSAVISIGRMRCSAAWYMAAMVAMPSCLTWL